MSLIRLRSVLVWMLLLLGAAPLAAAELETKTDTVYRKTLRGTAMIVSPEGQGAGWVVSRDEGLLVTRQHVVGDAKEVQVFFPAYRAGRVIPAIDSPQRGCLPALATDDR